MNAVSKHLNIVKIKKERIKMIYCQSVSRTSSELLFTNHLHHQKHQSFASINFGDGLYNFQKISRGFNFAKLGKIRKTVKVSPRENDLVL